MGRVYATGDVVRIHPAGYVEFAGRADNQVKIRGHRIELGEIEAVLDRHPDVVQSVVVARDDARRHPARRLRRPARTAPTSRRDALRKHVAEVLPEAMVPSVVVRLDAFPLTPNGKIDRKALPADAGVVSADAQRRRRRRRPTTPSASSPRSGAPSSSAPVGRDDNFFDIGGHSLLAVKVFRRLERRHGGAARAHRRLPLPDRPHVRRPPRRAAGRPATRRRAPAPAAAARRPAPTAARCAAGPSPAAAASGRRRLMTDDRRRIADAEVGRDRHRHRRDGRPVPRRARRRRALAARRRRRRLPRRPSTRASCSPPACRPATLDDPGLRPPQRRARRRRDVRRRVLRHRPARRGDHGSAAPPLHRVLLGGAGDVGPRARAVRRRDRRVRRLRHEHLHAQQPADEPARSSSRSACSCSATPPTTRTSSRRRCPTSSTCAARRSTCRRRARRRSSPSTSPCRACWRSSATSPSPAASTIEVPHRVGYVYHEGEILVARRRTAGRSTSARPARC